MRTIVDLPEDQIKALDLIGKKTKQSRAALLRTAVQKLLAEQNEESKGNLDKYFGLLKGSKAFEGMDGLAWQKKMRSEWDARDRLYDNWGALTKEEWEERFQRYLRGELD